MIHLKSMYVSLSKTFETAAGLLAVMAVAVLMAAQAHGQASLSPTPLPAPPPFKLVPRETRSQLEAARDLKARTRLSVELAEERLARAERLTSAQQYESASRELGIYQGILEDALRFLKAQKEQRRIRDIYKRFEIALRAQAPRIETIRRTTPSEYSVNVKMIADDMKNLRGEALNGFYGDTVIRDSSGEGEKAPDEGKAPEDGKATGSSKPDTPKDQP